MAIQHCFVITKKNDENIENISNIQRVLPGMNFINITIEENEMTSDFLLKMKFIDSIEDFKNKKEEEIRLFLSHKKIWSSIIMNNMKGAFIIDISATPVDKNSVINIETIMKNLPHFYEVVSFYDDGKKTIHDKCNDTFNYLASTVKIHSKAYYAKNEFCHRMAGKKLCDIDKAIAEVSLRTKMGYVMKYPVFKKYIPSFKDNGIKISLPMKKLDIKNDRVFIVKDPETEYKKNIETLKTHYKNSEVSGTLKDALVSIIKTGKGGFIISSKNPPEFDIFKNIPENVPETLHFLGWDKKNEGDKIRFNSELLYVRYNMPSINNYYVTHHGANLMLIIINENKTNQTNTILCRERAGFIYTVNEL